MNKLLNYLFDINNVDGLINVGFGIAFLLFAGYLVFYDKAFKKMAKHVKIMAIIACVLIGGFMIFFGLPFLPKKS